MWTPFSFSSSGGRGALEIKKKIPPPRRQNPSRHVACHAVRHVSRHAARVVTRRVTHRVTLHLSARREVRLHTQSKI